MGGAVSNETAVHNGDSSHCVAESVLKFDLIAAMAQNHCLIGADAA